MRIQTPNSCRRRELFKIVFHPWVSTRISEFRPVGCSEIGAGVQKGCDRVDEWMHELQPTYPSRLAETGGGSGETSSTCGNQCDAIRDDRGMVMKQS